MHNWVVKTSENALESTSMNIAEQIQQVRLNIKQYCTEFSRKPSQIRLLAVSKTHPVSAIQEAYASGITEFGESYLQEALVKIKATEHLPMTWHFIGPIQSNKTRPIAESFHWVQSADREKIVDRLNAQRPTHLAPLNLCIQANLFDEPQKKGVSLNQIDSLLAFANALPNICLRGIMVIPPKQSLFEQQAAQFSQVADEYERLKQNFPTMDTLSMGMSSDIRAAIAMGTSMVRIGTDIFGPRGVNHL